MNAHELIYNLNYKALDELLPITKVVTDEDVAYYKNKKYATVKFSQFKQSFPDLTDEELSHIYYEPNAVYSLYYYDYDEMLFFETRIYITSEGVKHLNLNGETVKEIIDLNKKNFKNCYDNNDFHSAFHLIPSAYKVEFFCKCLPKLPQNVIYDLFISLYTSADFGSKNLTDDIIDILLNAKTPQQKARTTRALNKITDANTIKVYRGIGDKSNTKGYSYTLNPNVANFFAFRHSTKADYVSVLAAEVNKKDVIEYIDNRDEEEVIIKPDALINTTYTAYNDIVFFINSFENVMSIYSKQRDRFFKFKDDSDFNFEMNDHDEQHMLRVLFLSIIMSEYYKLKKSLRPTLYNAAMFHDIGRTNDSEDTRHGADSYKLLCEYNKSFKNDELLGNLMTYHCLPDDKAFQFKNENEKLMYKILKDADALDRQRFGIRELDIKYLRLDFSHKLLFAASQLTSYKL